MSGGGYRQDEKHLANEWTGVVTAGLLAGPFSTFPLLVMFADQAIRFPGPESLGQTLGLFAMILFASIAIGVLPGWILCGIGNALMMQVQRHVPPAASWLAWGAAGLMLPVPIIAALFDAENVPAAYLMFGPAAGLCALICWFFQRDASPAG